MRHVVEPPASVMGKVDSVQGQLAGNPWPAVQRSSFVPIKERRRAKRTVLSLTQRWRGSKQGHGAFAFTVRDFCATGMSIVVHSHDHLLTIGQSFAAKLYVPEVAGAVAVRLEVRRVYITRTQLGALALYGLALVPASERARRQWSKAMLLHGSAFGREVTPVTLAHEGFVVASPARALAFTTASSAKDFAAVYALRYQCYKEAGLLQDPDCKPQDMADPFDARGKVVVAWHHDHVVATFRACLPSVDDVTTFDSWAHSREGLPPLNEAVEYARLAVHADFRGHDMLPTLCQLMGRYALQNGRRYILFGTNLKLAAYYARFGAVDTGLGGFYCGAPSKVLKIDLVQVHRHGTPLARYAMFGTPPPLDGEPVRMPRWRRLLLPKGENEPDHTDALQPHRTPPDCRGPRANK